MRRPRHNGRWLDSYGHALEHAVRFANTYGTNDRLSAAERFLTRCGFQTFGHESISAPGGEELIYLNTGDAYTATVCVKQGGTYYTWDTSDAFIACWGDWYSDKEAEYEDENRVMRCGWCDGG